VKDLFSELYGSQLKKPHTSVVECPFDDYFNTLVRDLESTSGALPSNTTLGAPNVASQGPGSSSDEAPPIPGVLKGMSQVCDPPAFFLFSFFYLLTP
jgi:signal recognition particle receptor subunit alpha